MIKLIIGIQPNRRSLDQPISVCLPLGSDVLSYFILFYDYVDDDSDESDMVESAEDNDDEEDAFMHSYSDAMSEELKATTLQKSFVRANEQIPKKDEVFCFDLHEGKMY